MANIEEIMPKGFNEFMKKKQKKNCMELNDWIFMGVSVEINSYS